MVLALDRYHVHRGMIFIIPLCERPRSMELTHYVCCKSIDLYFYLQQHHITTLAHQQSKLDASNLSIASFTWLRAFEDRTVLTYEHGTTMRITKLLTTCCKLDIDYSRKDRHPLATYAKLVACQAWNRSDVRGHVKFVQAGSSHYATNIQSTTKKQ